MNTTPVEIHNLLLHPWDDTRSDPPAAGSLEIAGDKITLTFGDFEAELAVELDKGRPRLLIYAPGCDSGVSVRWTENGLCLDTQDYTSEGGVLVPPTHT